MLNLTKKNRLLNDRERVMKIHDCIKSCNTIEQYKVALGMLRTFLTQETAKNVPLSLLTSVKDFALTKGTVLHLKKINNSLDKIENKKSWNRKS